MKIFQNKNHNEQNYKNILIVLFVMIFILMIISAMLDKIQKKQEANKNIDYTNLSTIKDVIEYHGSKYITEKQSEDIECVLDAYLVLKVLPYNEDDTSNEEYYNKLLEDCARVLYYDSFRLIDKENDITIKVICKNRKIDKILINDIEDYFIYMESQISMKKYKEIKITEFNTIDSEILRTCIDNKWKADLNFGERTSIFNEYNIYSDEGLKVREIQNKIYNIIFEKNYGKDVVNGLFPGIDLNSVEAELGKATFKDKELKVVGYKGFDFYIFFTENEISVYRNTVENTDEFFKLADKYINKDLDLLDFMNELTYLWPDYSEYTYSANSVFLSYPLKGLEITINNGDINGFLVYNNIRSTLSKIEKYTKNTDFVARLQIDCVYEAEKRRIEEKNKVKDRYDEYIKSLEKEKLELIGENIYYYYYPDVDSLGNIYSMKFISKDDTRPDRELNDSIDDFLWLNNDYFLYSKENKGIFLYNLQNGRIQRLVQGEEEFKFKEFNDGILKYDKEELEVQY